MGKLQFLKIKELLDKSEIEYKIIEHESVYTAEQASKVRNVPLKQGIKSLVLKTKEGRFILALVRGDRKLDLKKLAKIIGTKDLTLARPEEVLKITGCEIGSITQTVQRNYLNKNYVGGVLSFACSHPKLAKQWIEMTRNIGFSGFYVAKNKEKWSGINGISTRTKKDLENFLKLGGFLNNIKIGKNSPYYYGLEKQKVLIALSKFIETNKILDSLKELHSKIIYSTENLK